MTTWTTYEDDVDGLYGRPLGEGRYHFVRVTDMDDAAGEDNAGRQRYAAELLEVDLWRLGGQILRDARYCVGAEDEDLEPDHLACAVVQYGCYAPLWTSWGDDRAELEEAGKAESIRMEQDEDLHRAAMNRPVNALGSTAAEYMVGDLDAAIQRGLDRGDPAAPIMRKMTRKGPEESS